MSEYWLISAPGDKTCQQTWDTLNNVTSKQNNLSVNYKFHIPDLKVGTLDQLVGLSDDLGKLDTFVEVVTRKVAQYLGEVLEDQRDKLHENLMANNSVESSCGGDPGGGETGGGAESPVYDSAGDSAYSERSPSAEGACRHSLASSGRGSPHCWAAEDSEQQAAPEEVDTRPHVTLGQGDLPTYLTRFQWDMAKYPIKQSLRNIADIISKQVGQIDADLKTKSLAYNNLKGNLQNLEKKQTGSLLTRNLADLVKKEHFILDSEYLTTVLVIVPKVMFNEWNANYEKITDMIVPRSTQLVYQDNDFGLYTVSLFKKVVEEFKLHARERKFIVRDFSYNETELAAGKSEITKLVTDKKKQFGPLVRWLKVNFSECFCAWIHVKALRVFVESVLRYGLPVNFQAVVMVPARKSAKRLRDQLQQLYQHLDASAGQQGSSSTQDSVEIAGLGFGQADYYPYVYYKLNIDMIEQRI